MLFYVDNSISVKSITSDRWNNNREWWRESWLVVSWYAWTNICFAFILRRVESWVKLLPRATRPNDCTVQPNFSSTGEKFMLSPIECPFILLPEVKFTDFSNDFILRLFNSSQINQPDSNPHCDVGYGGLKRVAGVWNGEVKLVRAGEKRDDIQCKQSGMIHRWQIKRRYSHNHSVCTLPNVWEVDVAGSHLKDLATNHFPVISCPIVSAGFCHRERTSTTRPDYSALLSRAHKQHTLFSLFSYKQSTQFCENLRLVFVYHLFHKSTLQGWDAMLGESFAVYN